MRRTQDGERGNGGAGEFRGDVLDDGREVQDPNVEHLSGVAHGFEICTAEGSETEIDTLARYGLADDVGMSFDLIADGGSDEVRAIGINAFPDQQIDMAKVSEAEVDRDLLAICRFGA